MPTTVYGESNSTSGGTQYRYISAAYARNGNTGPLFLNFCGLSFYTGYGAVQSGSLVAASITGGSSASSTTNVVIYKNKTQWITAIPNVGLSSVPKTNSANFAVGINTYAAGDYFDVYLDGNGTYYVGVTLVFAEPGP